MGFDCPLKEIFSFIYRSKLDHDLIEYEYDHVLIGHYDLAPKPNPEEADNWKWTDPMDVLQELEKAPEKYTIWFQQSFNRVLEHIKAKAL